MPSAWTCTLVGCPLASLRLQHAVERGRGVLGDVEARPHAAVVGDHDVRAVFVQARAPAGGRTSRRSGGRRTPPALRGRRPPAAARTRCRTSRRRPAAARGRRGGTARAGLCGRPACRLATGSRAPDRKPNVRVWVSIEFATWWMRSCVGSGGQLPPSVARQTPPRSSIPSLAACWMSGMSSLNPRPSIEQAAMVRQVAQHLARFDLLAQLDLRAPATRS